MTETQTNKEIKYIDNVGTLLVMFGIIFIFTGIWVSFPLNIRCLITGILLILWGKGCWCNYERLKRVKNNARKKEVC